MNKFLLALLAVLLGVIGVTALRRDTRLTRWSVRGEEGEWRSGTNALADSRAAAEALRAEVLDKKNRLKEAMDHPQFSPEMLRLLNGDFSKGNLPAWAELRRQLGIGWDASPDYVLVSKAALKELEYRRLLSAKRVSGTTSELLGLSAGEQSGLAAAIQRVREGQTKRVERAEPAGDIVAEYTALPMDPEVAMSLSNSLAGDMLGVVGQDRVDLLLPQAWRELSGDLAPSTVERMIIRRTVVDGELSLTCEMQRDTQLNVMPVKYAIYPSSWFLSIFPGGWDELARREHFELPADFRPK